MTDRPFRLPAGGGAIDRSRPIRFVFDGRAYDGFQGDTLASALLANGVRLVGRSLKFHRPRGILGGGVEDPGGFVETGAGGTVVPLSAATAVELHEGLVARSLGGWPSVRFDVAGVLDRVAALLPAGFYYKTFKAPAVLWPVYERILRRMAGVARAPEEPDPDRYARRWHHADVLVVGGGPAGLAAALAAGAGGARVLLVEAAPDLGGSLLDGPETIDGRSAPEWVAEARARLAARPDTRVLTRATAVGHHDHGFVSVLERAAPAGIAPGRSGPRARLWKIRAKELVLATGALERPLVFADNDRPGVMLAGAVRAYLHRHAAAAGRTAVLFTNNDGAYRTAVALAGAGVAVAAVADAREEVGGPWVEAVRALGVPVLPGHAVAAVHGRTAVRGVTLARLTADGRDLRPGTERRFACDLIAQSGGWNPVVHLHAHVGGALRYDESTACLVPAAPGRSWCSAGSANGTFDLTAALAEGAAAGRAAAERAGFGAPASPALSAGPSPPLEPRPLWRLPALSRRAKRFVDLHNDVTVEDVALAVREGYRSVEHLKRYTTAGMGLDQGRTGNVLALGILAEERGEPVGAVGTTTFRPPYVPVPFGALAGRDVGALYEPTSTTPIHSWHAASGAEFQPSGPWLRPALFPRAGETRAAAIAREALAVRRGVGLFDSSTLGKIELHGPDAVELLERVYSNGWRSLPVGGARYGLMLREDGTILDDGVTARLGETHYLMSTTSGGARSVFNGLEESLQGDWPDLDVALVPVTAQWASVTLAGPLARSVLDAAGTDIALSPEAFPHMRVRTGRVAGLPARVFRVSFTGELSYEINVPAGFGLALWERLLAAGAPFGLAPFGLEAVHILRAEKGYIILGQDTDGSQTPRDVGLSALVADRKPDFIGRRGLRRSHLTGPGRRELVGLLGENPAEPLPEGACIIGDAAPASPPIPPPIPMIGVVTSSYVSPVLGRSIALALLRDGRARIGAAVTLDLGGRRTRAIVTEPRFYDPEGQRLHG